LVLALVAAATGVLAVAHADESYLHLHVRVDRNTGSHIVGEVLAEQEDRIQIAKGKTGWTWIDRDEIEKITSLESVWKGIQAKKAAAKTGEDWYQIGLALESEGFDRALADECFQTAIKVDPDHEKSRKRLGWEKRTDSAGKTIWKNKKEAQAFDATSGALKKDAAAQGDRPWAQYRICVPRPKGRPEYEIVTNLPEEQGADYADFMVELKHQLVGLIEKEVYGKSGKKIQWLPNPCKICGGKNSGCPRCGGSGEEPCTIFITNTHSMFMDLNPTPGLGGYFMPGPFPAGNRQESYGYITCERPIIAFHGTFGGTGNTFLVLAHEGTHQLEAKMWKGDSHSLFARPGWLTEGLACYFGDGLTIGPVDKKTGKRDMRVDVARDRLAGLKRVMKATPPGQGRNYALKDFTGFGIPEFQQDPGLYSNGWSLIYFMLNTKDKFKFNGKEVDLKDAFGRFFADNCEKGALEEFNKNGALGLVRALGVATNEKEAEDSLDALDKMWRDYVLKLPITSVGDFDAKDKKKWVSPELKFEISLPKAKKPKFDWHVMSTEDLNAVIFDEAMAFTDGNARVICAVTANTENFDIDDTVEYVYRSILRPNYGRYSSTEPNLQAPADDQVDTRPDPVEGTLPLSGLQTRTVTFTAKETKVPGYVDNPRPNKQKVKLLICATAAKVYEVFATCDEEQWPQYEAELNEMLASFAVTGV
jgi:hypothetical protein